METMVSIIVPTYNRANLIRRAIGSILKQTYPHYEVIIVDDGSTDETQEVIAGIQDDRIRYIALQENQGVAHARNVGIREAKYDYIAFLDSDDKWFPHKLELQIKKLIDSPQSVGMVYCRMTGVLRGSTERYVCPHPEFDREILEGNMFRWLLYKNVIGTPSMLVRRECLEQTGGFKETMQCLEDWELILRIARQWEIGFVDEILVEVHATVGSVSTNAIWHMIARCYMVSLYRREMIEVGMLDTVKQEILKMARQAKVEAEISELLNRDIEL